ncbi:MAG: hypothetical protein ACR2KW_06950 [Rubrobacter sp.]
MDTREARGTTTGGQQKKLAVNETPPGQWAMEFAGILVFAGLSGLLAWEILTGAMAFGYLWLLPYSPSAPTSPPISPPGLYISL